MASAGTSLGKSFYTSQWITSNKTHNANQTAPKAAPDRKTTVFLPFSNHRYSRVPSHAWTPHRADPTTTGLPARYLV